jgi:branched-chain amino acid transport system substrate-binding protein
MKCWTLVAATVVVNTALLVSSPASAEIRVGVIVSETGLAASLGIPEKNTVALLPKTVGGQDIVYTVFDDATDPTRAVQAAHKLISENHVDVLIGASTTPNALAITDTAADGKTPFIALSAASQIVSPVSGPRRWVFKTPQDDSLMASAVADAMVKKSVKSAGFIGFADSYGESWYTVFSQAAKQRGITVTTHETYARGDTSVLGQILRITSTHPDAVLMAGGGTPGALPARQLKSVNYRGLMYQTHSVANNDFLRVCGADCDGSFLAASPLLVAAQLPADNAVKAAALQYVQAYEAVYGPASTVPFGGYMWDAGHIMVAALKTALASAKPGTPEFRLAVRDALENEHEVIGSGGVFNMSKTNHNGLDQRARVIVEIKHGKWVYVSP